MYVVLRILEHMALVDFVTLPTYTLEQCVVLNNYSIIFYFVIGCLIQGPWL